MGKHAPLSYDVYFITPDGQRIIYAKRANTSYTDTAVPKVKPADLETLLGARADILEQIKKKGPSGDLAEKVVEINQKLMSIYSTEGSRM
jgi:hypothetical protein